MSQVTIPGPSPTYSRKSRVESCYTSECRYKHATTSSKVIICSFYETYGFYTECVRKYGSSHVWTYFTDMFDFLTLSVVIDDQIFCVHGGKAFEIAHLKDLVENCIKGLSPSIHSIDQIKVVDRFRGLSPFLTLLYSTISSIRTFFFIWQRSHMKVLWRILFGRTPIQTKKTLPFLQGETHLQCLTDVGVIT